ncbi:Tox-REase-5 domain-containing protein [Nitrospirillum sp. BR 11164]|uniref:Tox-REase-5 domain-containing protein n=1 Tax=Nitrospirillum sp. BR 11164 TaxID=3104324 RepID=UPI002AFFB82D|nr:Tox-REase-5 domain-containing protein [Nitrospirillum sp. BR 11164]MEA1649361.1 Tox-REase-5 domain-containing protein [Nitrospirillum sp. BR 11164]
MPDSFSSHAPFAAASGQAMPGWVEATVPEGRLLIGPTLAVPAGMRRYAITVPFRPWQDGRVVHALNSLDDIGRQRLRLVVDGVDHRCSTGQLMARVMADFANGSLTAYLIPHATPPISPPTTPPPHPAAHGEQEGDPPGQPAQWSMIQRVVGMLRRTIPYLPRDMQQAARSLFTLETLYWLAGFLAAWAVGHAAGYGEAIDVILLGVGYAMVGWSVFGGLNDLGHGVAMATTAKTEHDLDEAAKRTAAGLTVLTINALIVLIAKVKPASGGKRPPVVEEEPPPPPPPPDPPVKPVEPPPPPPKGPGFWKSVNESMSERASSYQAQITGRPGEAYMVDGVKFDGFADGTLLDAKGPGYASFVKDGKFRSFFRGQDSLLDQALRQTRAADGTPITWHVAEPEAATAMRNLLKQNDIEGITVVHTPMNP